MLKSALARWTIGTLVVVAVLGLLRFKPWSGFDPGSAREREELRVGFLPVT